MNPKSGRRCMERRPRMASMASGHASFELGEPVWVMEADGEQRRAEYMGARVVSVWRGGPPMAFVLYADSHSAEAVEMDRVIPRHTRREDELAGT